MLKGHQKEDGTQVLPNLEQAAEWLRKAANQGHAPAQYKLGVMYENGQGVEKNDAEAVRWFRLAAEQEMNDAQTSLKFLLKYQVDESPTSIEPFDFSKSYDTIVSLLNTLSGIFGFYEMISDEEMDHLQGAIPGSTPLHKVWSSLAQSVSSWTHILDRIQNPPKGLFITCLTPKTEEIKKSLLNTQNPSIFAFDSQGKFYLSLGEEAAALSRKLIQLIQKDGTIDQAIHFITQHQH